MPAADLIILLFERFSWLDEGLQTRLHDHGWPDVSRAQSMVMVSIVSGTTRPADVARRLGVSRQAVHGTIAQLVEKGIVTLEDDPADRRHKRLAVTEFGQRMRDDARQSVTALAELLAERIGRARLDALLDALLADWGPTETVNLLDS